MIADEQHADLAQHQDADHVDDENVGAEPAEMEDALLGDDAADQEGDQQDDRHRPPADAVELMHQRGQAEAGGRVSDAQHGDDDRAEHAAGSARSHSPTSPWRGRQVERADEACRRAGTGGGFGGCRDGAPRPAGRGSRPASADDAGVAAARLDSPAPAARAARRRRCRAARPAPCRCRRARFAPAARRARRRSCGSSSPALSAVHGPAAESRSRSPSTVARRACGFAHDSLAAKAPVHRPLPGERMP